MRPTAKKIMALTDAVVFFATFRSNWDRQTQGFGLSDPPRRPRGGSGGSTRKRAAPGGGPGCPGAATTAARDGHQVTVREPGVTSSLSTVKSRGHDMPVDLTPVTAHAFGPVFVLDVRVDAGRAAVQLLDRVAVLLDQIKELLVPGGEPVEHETTVPSCQRFVT